MAIDYWKLGGKPNNFNPLAVAIPANKITGLNVGMDYTISFYASSKSNGIIRIEGDSNTYKTITTTSTRTFYSVTFTSKETVLYIDNNPNTNDVIVDSIQLNYKAMPKLTINGIDGFLSGKWSLHPNAQVIDDETLILNATGVNQNSYLIINALPNQNYMFNIENGYGKIAVDLLKSDGTYIITKQVSASGIPYNLQTTSDTGKLQIWFTSNSAGQFTFKRPMLNLGSVPAPYSKKTGDKMVLPIAKKNLFDGALENGWIDVTTGQNSSFPTRTRSINYLPVKPNTKYYISTPESIDLSDTRIYFYDINKAFISNAWTNGAIYSFTTPSNCMFIRFANAVVSDITKRYQLEEGTTATSFTPYAVQVNKKPQKYVPKKNLIDGQWEQGSMGSLGTLNGDSTRIRTVNFIPVQPNTVYVLSCKTGYMMAINTFDGTKTGVTQVGWQNSGYTFTTGSNVYYLKLQLKHADDSNITISEVTSGQPQLEQNSTATAYEPYQLVLPKAKTGLAFNGVTDYLQLPSMTMDSIEIECNIDVNQTIPYYILDARTGSLTGYVGGNDALVGVGSAWSDFLINGVSVAKTSNSFIKGQRVKMKFVSSSPFTDNVTIFSNYLIKEMTKGIIYKVTCYLGGQIVAQYDFENPKTVVGSSVLPNPVNLIPSFEDARWSLHANAKVLGKDFLHLDATTGQQDSTIILPVQPNTNYQLLGNLSNGSYLGGKLDNVNFQWATISAPTQPFKTASNQTSVTIYLRSTVAGSFDFLKPQLYQLSGLEGTLSGTPQPQTKQSKRSLYAKR